MYTRYVENLGLKIEPMDSSPSELGGLKEAIFRVSGVSVFRRLRYESGVHRVQRVPATEAQGRIHTSTATVAVLPEAEEVELELKPEDLRIEVCRAGGPGGQGVNTTDSAVQVMHIPTGTIVRCQDGRSQIKNKERALNILRARLLERKQAEEEAAYSAHRKSQIGSGGREEKIRTYNFPQNRVTDHRINVTLYNLDRFMEGDLGGMIESLQTQDMEERLAAANLTVVISISARSWVIGSWRWPAMSPLEPPDPPAGDQSGIEPWPLPPAKVAGIRRAGFVEFEPPAWIGNHVLVAECKSVSARLEVRAVEQLRIQITRTLAPVLDFLRVGSSRSISSGLYLRDTLR